MPDTLVKYIKSAFSRGRTVSPDFIDFPRGQFGARPIVISALADRAPYKALIATISDSLPKSSRSDLNRQVHGDFGLHRNGYVADIDIVLCYEYIDHAILFEELVTNR